MKGTVGIVDFHAATNYGSALLAYALQRVVSDMGYDCSIINYQPQKQVDGYRLPILVSRHPVKRWIESLCWLPYNKQMKRKVDKFKSFAHDYMRLTPYCCDPSKINEECGTFDYYIAGATRFGIPDALSLNGIITSILYGTERRSLMLPAWTERTENHTGTSCRACAKRSENLSGCGSERQWNGGFL